jgi:hypothetical protein
MSVVGRFDVFHWISDVLTNPDPVTVTTKFGLKIGVLFGEIAVTTGVGFTGTGAGGL